MSTAARLGPPGVDLGDTTVLVVGAPSPRRAQVAAWLSEEGCSVQLTADLDAALRPTSSLRPDAVVLDVGDAAPGAVAGLRGWSDAVIVAVDRGRGAALEAVLRAGADDYVAAPLRRTELLARLAACLRRRRPPGDGRSAPPLAVTADFELDVSTHRAEVRGLPVHLTPTEWRMVEVLVARPGALVAQADLVRMIWGSEEWERTHSLRVHLNSVRNKLEPEPHRPRYFVTETGAGLRYVPDGPAAVGRYGT